MDKQLFVLAFLSLGFVSSALAADKPPASKSTPAEKSTRAAKSPPTGKELFDGKTLDGWKVTDFGGQGKVEVRDKTIVMARGSDMTGVTYTGKPPKSNYELTLEGERVKGDDFFCTTTFPVGDKCCSFVTGGWGGSVIGLSNVDHMDASENETSKSHDFKNGTWYKFRIRVTDDKIEVWIDDKQVVDQERKDHTFGVRIECDPCCPLGIATYDTVGAVRNIRLRELKESKEPPKKTSIDLGGGVKMEMVVIPAGEFMMGSKESAEETAAFYKKGFGKQDFITNFFKALYGEKEELTAETFKDEHPQHRVRITRPFYLGTYHVTLRQFRKFVKESGHKMGSGKDDGSDVNDWWRNSGVPRTDDHPVDCISWNDAVAFCKWLSKRDGKTYRLPTEAEWEYACRAGTTTHFYSGDDPESVAKVGNVADAAYNDEFPHRGYAIKANDGYVYTSPVGKFKPNRFGLYDMHGNVYQWCADRYGAGYYAKSPVDDPKGSDSGDWRVVRGGCWGESAYRSASAYRFAMPQSVRGYPVGFRVARTQ